ncbi:MAG: hypothetical protein JSW64_00175 [Candidatus Zixiibacteriota bacterium]|nr:MAG: hypothetical protein JSW64_00175 [candidate division Zixibacteria bacterium]
MKKDQFTSKALKSAIVQVAGMMEIAARTAPKSRGEDFVRVEIITGRRLKDLADAMLRFGIEKKKENFDRDSGNLRNSVAAVLIGIKDATVLSLDCGACGYSDCAAFKKVKKHNGDFKGPLCAYRLLDFGIALGSAVKTAQMFNVDNRIMYRIGVAARWTGMVDWDYVMGIPLAATGKNIFFDRGLKQKTSKNAKKA